MMKQWEQAWLCYGEAAAEQSIVCQAEGAVAASAVEELKRSGISYDATLTLAERAELGEEGYALRMEGAKAVIEAAKEVGLLYGAFELIRRARCGQLPETELVCVPDQPYRMLNHWDNMDGSIERGYSGQSFFFEKDEIVINERTKDYARLAASVGINASVINNVNVKGPAVRLITDDHLDRLKEMQEIFSAYGIRLYISLDFAASMDIGGLATADPLDPEVRDWWKAQMNYVYSRIPQLGGFLVKADSEGRPGPFTYGRNQADGANMLAEAIAPHGGQIIWRCFVYNCQQDWRDTKTDRARAAFDYFYDLDGKFAENVLLQIKNGPIDFQVREPFTPLFGKLEKTNYLMEVQIAQEYTGQQIDLCYLIPWFEELLHTHTGNGDEQDTIGEILSGKGSHQVGYGLAAVCNTGNDANWTGHDLAAANLYGYGRLAWNHSLSSREIAKEWILQTFPAASEADRCLICDTVLELLMMSWPTYEKYAAPMGVGFMVNPSFHYGPNVDGYEYSRWGTYHRADHLGVGVDRSSASGTGYAGLYHPLLAQQYETAENCPDNLLLFFHHVPYTHVLHSGETVIQHIYNTHFEGYEDVKRMISMWETLEGKVAEPAYGRVKERLARQLANAREWCDQVNSYFWRKSGIADEKNRQLY